MVESHKRSVVKAMTWRFLATVITMSLVLIFTGSWEWAGMIGIFDVLTKLLVYYGHERAWDNVAWGRKKNK